MEQKRKDKEMKQKRIAEVAQDKLPASIKFQGATGAMAHSINGVYKYQKSGKTDPDGIFYRKWQRPSLKPLLPSQRKKISPNTSISCDSSGRWKVMQGSNMLAYCGLTGLPNPCNASRWYVANSAKSFSFQPSVIVKKLDAKQERTHTQGRDRGSPCTPDCSRISALKTIRRRPCFTPRLTSFSSVDVKINTSPYIKAVARMQKIRKHSFDVTEEQNPGRSCDISMRIGIQVRVKSIMV